VEQQAIKEFIGWLVPFVCGAAVGAVVLWFAAGKALCEGVQCLLRAEIIRQNEKWVARGYCPVWAKQALERAYKVYHRLKGNDVATALYEETMELPESPIK
jgi:hypothetical protein